MPWPGPRDCPAALARDSPAGHRSSAGRAGAIAAPAARRAPQPSPALPRRRLKWRPHPRLHRRAMSYANCTAVRAAGAAPIRVGQPGYSTKLDRDGDGVGCE